MSGDTSTSLPAGAGTLASLFSSRLTRCGRLPRPAGAQGPAAPDPAPGLAFPSRETFFRRKGLVEDRGGRRSEAGLDEAAGSSPVPATCRFVARPMLILAPQRANPARGDG